MTRPRVLPARLSPAAFEAVRARRQPLASKPRYIPIGERCFHTPVGERHYQYTGWMLKQCRENDRFRGLLHVQVFLPVHNHKERR